MRTHIMELIKRHKLIAILRGIEDERIVPVLEALHDGGIRLVEIPFNHRHPEGIKNTQAVIAALSQHFGSRMSIGAGTVMTAEQVDIACEAGATFILSPDTCESVIARTKELSLLSVPGAATPTEIARAYRLGADLVKLFPAADLGTGYMKSVLTPLGHIPILAVGGIDDSNLTDWLQAGAVGIGVGGQLVQEKLVREKQYEALTALAAKYTSQIDNMHLEDRNWQGILGIEREEAQ
ncbi:bifunctional 4-hydroxy-2-oxoglutarate aldolase/2-dehydro-3-deoxy-phosphogluconate aldolase [Paenibacillus sp. N3.4]|uniref:bifunctional 4-hydroxy-2-oxoglutarate aldolase/2-dehydro-3-deoxy-phosphogluconate aldolase n=1 Tax=Paenibacillus sp. N3.4 TaxID=2603222 RepID=UPI0011CC803C|nr:bifunctional 4-hydroxy-2-oxoglutarate aldolase/2-dehydro-3-deoxy-phosphogluconate aldolase [Paenibacillus sp. N3.4]TXK84276.1 bifunctional 4-hydroxy-2-oxoglutarate aldolase/2-dehydro-3-deoxy-phosphogluconate aldolase [Paenibacillus sp. N3.4]